MQCGCGCSSHWGIVNALLGIKYLESHASALLEKVLLIFANG